MDNSERAKIDGGLVIMFDGPDGIGKTTQLQLAAEALKHQYDVYSTRIHGGTPIGEALRQTSLSNLDRQPATDMFISLAIHSELSVDIRQNNLNGMLTLVDRSPLSIIAYQAYGSGLDKADAYAAVDKDLANFSNSHIVVYAVEQSVFMNRIAAKRAGNANVADYFETKPSEYFERVAEGYQDAAKRYEAKIIDASGTIEEVHSATMSYIGSLLS